MARKKIGKNAPAHYIQEEVPRMIPLVIKYFLFLKKWKMNLLIFTERRNVILALQAITYLLPIWKSDLKLLPKMHFSVDRRNLNLAKDLNHQWTAKLISYTPIGWGPPSITNKDFEHASIAMSIEQPQNAWWKSRDLESVVIKYLQSKIRLVVTCRQSSCILKLILWYDIML